MVSIRPDLATRWSAPTAAELPELRLHLREHVLANDNPDFVVRVAHNRNTVFPNVDGPANRVAGVGVAGSLKVAQCERRRLAEAQLYWVDEDMTSLALATADTPIREAVSARRMPAEAGLVVFAHPIGGRDLDPALSLANLGFPNACKPGTLLMPTPIVAVSWSYWTSDHLTLDGVPDARWSMATPNGLIPLDSDVEGVWLTFWTPGAQGWDALPPDAVLSGGPGVSITVAELAELEAQHGVLPLRSLSETVLPFGRPLPRPPSRHPRPVGTRGLHDVADHGPDRCGAADRDRDPPPFPPRPQTRPARRGHRARRCAVDPRPHPTPPVRPGQRRGRGRLLLPPGTPVDTAVAGPPLPAQHLPQLPSARNRRLRTPGDGGSRPHQRPRGQAAGPRRSRVRRGHHHRRDAEPVAHRPNTTLHTGPTARDSCRGASPASPG